MPMTKGCHHVLRLRSQLVLAHLLQLLVRGPPGVLGQQLFSQALALPGCLSCQVPRPILPQPLSKFERGIACVHCVHLCLGGDSAGAKKRPFPFASAKSAPQRLQKPQQSQGMAQQQPSSHWRLTNHSDIDLSWVVRTLSSGPPRLFDDTS
eukprot:4724608-Amphidinium_carterae.1